MGQVEGANVEIDTHMRDMEDRTRAMGWATTDADAPVRGIAVADVAAVCLSPASHMHTHIKTPAGQE